MRIEHVVGEKGIHRAVQIPGRVGPKDPAAFKGPVVPNVMPFVASLMNGSFCLNAMYWTLLVYLVLKIGRLTAAFQVRPLTLLSG